ncbi:holin [Burkholderia phage BcepNazgul]|uniref:Holin n=1 Tax=Burkholderia phage BcepNazgul TaxID=242861 RepID=Q6UYK2_9CAUD|nr:holin [Burkholderia phage BcepNazgul]AAQ63339.1 holin [Burkholderia phage BcepNazgul]
MNNLFELAAVVAAVALAALVAVFLYSRFFLKQRVQLVDDWRNLVKFSSTWFIAVGVVLQSWIEVAPDTLLHVWVLMPDDMKALIPPQYARFVPIAIIVLAVPFRIIKQARLARTQPRPETPNAPDHS